MINGSDPEWRFAPRAATAALGGDDGDKALRLLKAGEGTFCG